jgi:putative copper export protein
VVALHLLGIAVWVGGLTYQTHVLLPVARRGRAEAFVEAARRGRPATWTAVGLVVLTGFYNVTQLGPLERVAQSGAGLMLAGKFILVIAAISLAAQRDFSLLPRLARAVRGGEDPHPALRTIAALDHAVLLLAVVMIYLGVAIARA